MEEELPEFILEMVHNPNYLLSERYNTAGMICEVASAMEILPFHIHIFRSKIKANRFVQQTNVMQLCNIIVPQLLEISSIEEKTFGIQKTTHKIYSSSSTISKSKRYYVLSQNPDVMITERKIIPRKMMRLSHYLKNCILLNQTPNPYFLTDILFAYFVRRVNWIGDLYLKNCLIEDKQMEDSAMLRYMMIGLDSKGTSNASFQKFRKWIHYKNLSQNPESLAEFIVMYSFGASETSSEITMFPIEMKRRMDIRIHRMFINSLLHCRIAFYRKCIQIKQLLPHFDYVANLIAMHILY